MTWERARICAKAKMCPVATTPPIMLPAASPPPAMTGRSARLDCLSPRHAAGRLGTGFALWLWRLWHHHSAGFSVTRLSLVTRGFIYAIAHIRGGKARGHNWFMQGRGPKKQTALKILPPPPAPSSRAAGRSPAILPFTAAVPAGCWSVPR